jgi:hypothetical protein
MALSLRAMASLVGVCLCTSGAVAQSVPGGSTGVKVGDGRLHPFFQADTHFVINPGYSAQAPNDLVLVARPGLDLELPSEKLDLKFSGDVEYQRYLGVASADTRKYSTFAAQAGMFSTINKQGAVVLRLHENFNRDAEPGQISVGKRLLHLVNDVGLGLDVRPGGGALIFSTDYSFFIDRYDRSDNDVLTPKNLDNMRHNPKLRASWKFLPKTAVFLETEGYITRFYNSTVNPGSNLLLAYLGAAGSITSRISTLFKAGYGNTFIGGADNFNSFVGQAEVHYTFTETTGFKAGIARTVQPTSLFKYFALNRAYVGYRQAFSGRIQTDLTLYYDDLRYGTAVTGPTTKRADSNVVGEAMVTYQVNDWFTVSLADRLNLLRTDYRVPTAQEFQTGAPPTMNLNYTSNDLYLRAAFRY